MSQEIQDLADFVFGTQSTQQYPNPAPSDPGPSHSSAIVHPGNTETHGLHAGFSDPAGSSANSGEAAQEVSELGTGDLLLDWDPAAIDQHAETDEASNSVVVSHTDAALQMEVAQQTGTPAMNDSGTIGENNSENTDDTDTPGPLPDVDFNEVLHPSTNDTGTQQVLFSFGMQAGNFMENLSVQNLSNHMPPPLTAEQQAILAQGGMLVAEAEAIIASALANGRLSRYAGNGPSREEAVEFVAGLERVELGSLAEDDRDCGICRGPYGEPVSMNNTLPEKPVKLPCGHVFGDECILLSLSPKPEGWGHRLCPLCRRWIAVPKSGSS